MAEMLDGPDHAFRLSYPRDHPTPQTLKAYLKLGRWQHTLEDVVKEKDV